MMDVYHVFLIYPFIEGLLGCLDFLVIVTWAALNIVNQVSIENDVG